MTQSDIPTMPSDMSPPRTIPVRPAVARVRARPAVATGTVERSVKPRAVNRPARNVVAWVVIAMFLHLVSVDSLWATLIPMLNPSRVAILGLLGAFFLFGRHARGGTIRLGTWIVLFLTAGLLSNSQAILPLLGNIKLAMYAALMIPLLVSKTIRNSFMPDRDGFWPFAIVALGFLLLSAGFMPSTGTGILDNANKLGMFTVCTWPIFMMQTRESTRLRWSVGWMGLIACFALCAVAWSRGSMVGLIAGVVSYAALRISPTIRSLIIAAIIVGTLGAGVYFAGEAFQEYAFKGRDSFVDYGRQFAISETLNAWSYRPLFGYGFGMSWTMSLEDAEMAMETGRMSWFTLEFGNSTVAMLSGGGLAIAVLFYGLVANVLLVGFSSLRRANSTDADRNMQLAIVAGVIGLCVHAQAEAWMLSPLTWPTFMLWFYLGLSAELSDRIARSARAPGEIVRPA